MMITTQIPARSLKAGHEFHSDSNGIRENMRIVTSVAHVDNSVFVAFDNGTIATLNSKDRAFVTHWWQYACTDCRTATYCASGIDHNPIVL